MLLISLFVLYFKKLKTIPLILTKDQSFLQAWKASSIDKKTVIRLLAAQLLFGLCQMMCTIAKGFPLLYVFLWFFIENMLLAVSYSLLSENMPASIPDHQPKHQKAWNVFLVVLSAGTVVYGLRTMPVLIKTAPLSVRTGALRKKRLKIRWLLLKPQKSRMPIISSSISVRQRTAPCLSAMTTSSIKVSFLKWTKNRSAL